MFCHDKFLLQYDTFIVSLIDGMKSSHFDLYYLYSNTITRNTKFENDVEMYGAQTKIFSYTGEIAFENDVEMYGAQTIVK